jgi:cytochrome c-type biogenesis protein CcmH/NrfG
MKNKVTGKRVQKLLQKLAENPRDTETLLALGKLYFLGSQFDDAVKCYEAILEEDSQNSSAYYNLAVAFLAQKKTDEAKEAFQKALELDPNNEAAQKELAKLVSFP